MHSACCSAQTTLNQFSKANRHQEITVHFDKLSKTYLSFFFVFLKMNLCSYLPLVLSGWYITEVPKCGLMVFDEICEPFKPLFVGCGVLRGYLLDKILSFYSNMDLIGSKNEKTKRPPIRFQLSLGFTLCAKNTSTAYQIWSSVSKKGQLRVKTISLIWVVFSY